MTARRFLIAVLLVASGFAGGLAFLGRMRAEEQAIAQPPAARTVVTRAMRAATKPRNCSVTIRQLKCEKSGTRSPPYLSSGCMLGRL